MTETARGMSQKVRKTIESDNRNTIRDRQSSWRISIAGAFSF